MKLYDSGRFHNKETEEVTYRKEYEDGPQPGAVSVDSYFVLMARVRRDQIKLYRSTMYFGDKTKEEKQKMRNQMKEWVVGIRWFEK